MKKHDASNQNVYQSETRYKTAYNALSDIDYNDGFEHAKKILSGYYGFLCQYDKKLDFDTIWSSIFDIKNYKIYRAEENPRRAIYKEDKRLKNIKNGYIW